MAEPNLIRGTTGNDLLQGTVENDRIYGGTGTDRISGSSGNDVLAGGKGVDYLYGGLGNDTFAFSINDFDRGLGAKPQDYIWDFKGAGDSGKGAGVENDFLRFTGFGADSTLVKDAAASAIADKFNPGLSYYTLTDSNTGNQFTIAIKDGGHELVKGDFGFYETGGIAA